MRYIVCYDISDKKTLRKVVKRLDDFACRIQKSVFMGDLQEAEVRKLQREISAVIDRKTDSVIFLPVCQNCLEKACCMGTADISMKQDGCMIL